MRFPKNSESWIEPVAVEKWGTALRDRILTCFFHLINTFRGCTILARRENDTIHTTEPGNAKELIFENYFLHTSRAQKKTTRGGWMMVILIRSKVSQWSNVASWEERRGIMLQREGSGNYPSVLLVNRVCSVTSKQRWNSISEYYLVHLFIFSINLFRRSVKLKIFSTM